MYRKQIAITFVIIFMSLIVAPSVIAAFDDSIDTSVFYSLTEEEENCKSKIASHFSFDKNDATTDISFQTSRTFSYQFKNYPKPHLNLISPPPEHIIL